MKAKFYDVKEHKSVNADVTEKVTYANGRHAFKGATKDGRSLTKFVSQADFDKCDAKETKVKAKKCACKK